MSSIRARTHFATDANVLGQVQSVVRIVAVALGAAGIVAVAVRLLVAARARQVIAYRFPSGTLGWRGAGDILVNNARIALAPLAAAYLLDAIRPADGKPWRGWRRVLRSACDTVLGIAVLTNVFVAGASYGAYGLKMVRYTLPYAPVELAALACPLALYLETRQKTPSRRRLLALCGAGALLLATSALMEGLLPPL